jgi:hypothetical protein
MCDGDLGNASLGGINGRLCDLLAQTDDLSYFFEEKYISWLVTVDTQTSRIVASVFLSGKAIAQDFKDLLAILQVHSQPRRIPIH